MKINKNPLFFFLLFLATFLNSCDQKKYRSNEPNNPFHFSPIEQILKMHPVKITIARWIDYMKETKLKMGTEEEAKAAFNNPANWITVFETNNVNEINIIMTALDKPPIESGRDYMLPMGDKISFEDKKGDFRSTSFYLLSDLNNLYLSNNLYGQETYKVFARIMGNIKYELPKNRDTNQPSQKRSE
jgi:hypothetical protein